MTDLTAGFRDRREAGNALAERLVEFAGPSTIVVGLARGGVPVAAAVAQRLGAPLDILVVRKIGSPLSKELALGAVTADGERLIDPTMVQRLGVPQAWVEWAATEEQRRALRQERQFRAFSPPLSFRNRTVIVVDDGLATGATMRMALKSIRTKEPRILVAAVPVAAPEAIEELESEADSVVCLLAPKGFRAVGEYYQDFTQVEDATVIELLGTADRPAFGGATNDHPDLSS